MKKRIVSWYVAVEWSDNPKNEVVDIPDWVATNVDKYLNKLEDEVNLMDAHNEFQYPTKEEGKCT
mgnify:FL=1|jgi:hypothetical protein